VASLSKSILTRYARLVSFPTLPPQWAFGLRVSFGFKPDSGAELVQRATATATALRDHDVPCDLMHLDAHWQRFGRWSEVVWDTDRFPDPERLGLGRGGRRSR
jgi:alpha-D-xyloside xylohydrolase